MGGLFGGGKSKTSEPRQELNPPVDMSGAKMPGDDKIHREMQMASIQSNSAKRAGTTLLGRSANEPKVGDTTAAPSAVVNYA